MKKEQIPHTDATLARRILDARSKYQQALQNRHTQFWELKQLYKKMKRLIDLSSLEDDLIAQHFLS
jgi:hypothetical protein